MSEERKLVTVLFADVTGSTTLGEELDSEDVRVLMGRYYAHARDSVAAHGGTLEKFIGDAVMAIFGFPEAHSDDAERAVAAALMLRKAVADDEVLGQSFLLRIGINTGEVVTTGDLSSGDFLVTGDAVNVAARLQQSADPGEIMVGERTVQIVHAAFLFDEPYQIEVKGKRLPLHIFPLKGTRVSRKADHPSLVGRKRDLLQLTLLLERAQESQRPQLVSLVAPTGAGKTRLLEEFVCGLELEGHVKVAMVHCPSYGHSRQKFAYQPLQKLLTELLEAEITRLHLIELLLLEGCTQEDAFHLAEVIYTALMFEGERSFKHEQFLMGWRLLLKALAQQAPLVIILDDFHCVNDALLSLVEHLLHVRIPVPLLLITSSGPLLFKRRPNWGGGVQNFTSLTLSPLSTSLLQSLLTQQSQHIPMDQCRQIAERSGGNPFFALELAHSFSNQALVGSGMPPDIICSAVLARLDQLSKDEREVLQTASVLGHSFHAEMLHVAQERYCVQEIDAILERLQENYLIVPVKGNTFAFQCPLIHEVTYSTLSRSLRIQLHGKIASWLEANTSDQAGKSEERIAYHHREVMRLARQSIVTLDVCVETKRAMHFLQQVWKLSGSEQEGSLLQLRA